jgi:hypothetical protein
MTRRHPDLANVAPFDAQEAAVALATFAGLCLFYAAIGFSYQPLGWIWAPLLVLIAVITG